MNLVDCYVTKVLEPPQRGSALGVEWWTVKVEYISWGAPAVIDLWRPSQEEAEKVKEGFHFLA